MSDAALLKPQKSVNGTATSRRGCPLASRRRPLGQLLRKTVADSERVSGRNHAARDRGQPGPPS